MLVFDKFCYGRQAGEFTYDPYDLALRIRFIPGERRYLGNDKLAVRDIFISA